MPPKSFARTTKLLSVSLAALIAFSSITAAHPNPAAAAAAADRPIRQQDDTKKKVLPPINYVRSRDVDIKHLAIALSFDWDKEQVIGTTTVNLAPFKDLNKFYLDAAAMTIKSVTFANGGAALKFNYDAKKEDNNLEIMLDRVYKRGEDMSVKIEYATNYVNKADADTAIGSFGRGVRFIKPTTDEPKKPYQIWSQGETEFNRYWFPSYDSPNDFRTTELRATVKKPFMVISNGKLMDVKDNGDNTRTYYWKMDTPYANYLTSIVVGEYTEIKNGEYLGVPVYAYGYPSEAKEVAATTKNIVGMVKFFSEKTGVKYAYPKYSQTMVEDFGGGMENISATTQIEEMIHDERELLDEDSDSLQSHELAHQWFGDYVTTRQWSDIWLNESFATYFQALWDEESKGKDYFLYNDVRSNQNAYLQTWNSGNRRPIVTKYYANKDAMFDNYAYPTGGAVLHMLRKHLGDDLFFKSLNHYLVKNANQPVETEQLRIAFEETTGQSMDWFFNQWLYKMGHPIFEVTQNYNAANKQLVLNVKQTQKVDLNNPFPQVEFFQTYVDIEIGTPTGTRVERVWIEPKETNVFTFNADQKPNLVNFDYEGTLIKELKFDKSVDELLYQMKNDRDILGRRWAIGELSGAAKNPATAAADKDRILAALVDQINGESSWLLRRVAITEARGIIQPRTDPGSTPAALKLSENVSAALQKAAKDQQSLVRSDAIGLLGASKDTRFADLYFSALNDRSYAVVTAAAQALAGTKSPKAYDALVKLSNTPSWKGRLQNAGLLGLAELADPRSFDLGYKLATDKTQLAAVRTTALRLVGATGKGDARAFPLIFDAFKTALDGNNFQGIFGGLQAIAKLGDPRGQQAFDLMKEKFKDQSNLMNFVTMLEQQFKNNLNQK